MQVLLSIKTKTNVTHVSPDVIHKHIENQSWVMIHQCGFILVQKNSVWTQNDLRLFKVDTNQPGLSGFFCHFSYVWGTDLELF